MNNEVVHGLPDESKTLKDGDLVTLDLGAEVNGWFADSAITVGVGSLSSAAHNLQIITRQALKLAIKEVVPGETFGDIGYSISQYAKKHRYGVAHNLTGHFIGNSVHEAPEVPNMGHAGQGLKMIPGMTFCIEPMFTIGSGSVQVAGQEFWTVVTVDGTLAAHFEHTVAVTETGCEILTKI